MNIRHVALLPPWTITLFFLSLWVLLSFAMFSAPSSGLVVNWSQLMLANLVLVLGQGIWVWSLFQHASARSPIRYRWANWVFFATLVSFPSLAVLGWMYPELLLNTQLRAERGGFEALALDSLILFCVVAFLSCHWYATRALLDAETARGYRSNNELSTFVLMLYLFLGVWFLRPRVASLL